MEETKNFPTKDEKKSVYLFCTKSRTLTEKKKKFSAERKPLNEKSKEVRAKILSEMLDKNVTCYKVDDQYLRVQECKSYVALTDEIVSEGVYALDRDKYDNVHTLIDDLVNVIDENRTRRKQYAKVMKTPPKAKTEIETTPNIAVLTLLREYDENQTTLVQARNREKEQLQATKDDLKDLKENVNAYMVRVNLDSQRVNLPWKDDDEKVKGLAETFFLRRKQKTVHKKISKKDLNILIVHAMENIPLEDFPDARDIIVQRILNKAGEFTQVTRELSFDQGGLKKV